MNLKPLTISFELERVADDPAQNERETGEINMEIPENATAGMIRKNVFACLIASVRIRPADKIVFGFRYTEPPPDFDLSKLFNTPPFDQPE